eukprot:scaffold99943_cov39-Prasinocladus_malaysianus.AAC.2
MFEMLDDNLNNFYAVASAGAGQATGDSAIKVSGTPAQVCSAGSNHQCRAISSKQSSFKSQEECVLDTIEYVLQMQVMSKTVFTVIDKSTFSQSIPSMIHRADSNATIL